MKQKLILLLLVLCVCLPVAAQHRQEFSVNAGYGLSLLNYSYDAAEYKNGTGCNFGLGYTYFFAPEWGFRTGLGIGFFNAEITADALTGTYLTQTNPNVVDNLEFTYAYTNYKESASAMLLSIPIMIQYQGEAKTAFYAAAGVKIGIPVNADVTTTGKLSTSGYDMDIMQFYGPPNGQLLPQYGFSHYDVNQTTSWDANIAFILSVEAGVKFSLTDTWSLYAGVYFDYGLNSINRNDTPACLVGYQPASPDRFTYDGIINGDSHVKPIAAGVTLRLGFGRTK